MMRSVAREQPPVRASHLGLQDQLSFPATVPSLICFASAVSNQAESDLCHLFEIGYETTRSSTMNRCIPHLAIIIALLLSAFRATGNPARVRNWQERKRSPGDDRKISRSAAASRRSNARKNLG